MLDGILHLGVNLSIEQDENKLNIYNNSILLSTVLFDTEEEATTAVNSLVSISAAGSRFINFDTKSFENETKLLISGKDVDTGLVSDIFVKNGALQVDLKEIEEVQLNLPEGTALDVAVQNTSPIPVSLPEGNVGVEVNNVAAIPVSLPEGNIGVEFPEAQEIKNASGAPLETVLQYTFGTAKEEWKPRTGTATITVATDALNSDIQNGYGKSMVRFLMPVDPVGTAFKIQHCTTIDGTFRDLQNDAGQACSFDVTEDNKGKWVTLDIKERMARDLFFFRFVSNDTETANQSIEYQLG